MGNQPSSPEQYHQNNYQQTQPHLIQGQYMQRQPHQMQEQPIQRQPQQMQRQPIQRQSQQMQRQQHQMQGQPYQTQRQSNPQFHNQHMYMQGNKQMHEQKYRQENPQQHQFYNQHQMQNQSHYQSHYQKQISVPVQQNTQHIQHNSNGSNGSNGMIIHNANNISIDLMNINDKITQFKQRELSEEEQFIKAQEKLREIFRKKQEERRKRFYAEVESFEKGNENPYQILGISMDIDTLSLKKAYKKMAVKHHPDKGGNPEIFKKITQAYIYVLDKVEKSKRMNRTYEDAKTDFDKPSEEYIDKQVKETVRKYNLDGDNFSLEKFNKLFNEFRISDPNDKGYGDGWEDETVEYNQPVFNQKFNKDVFHKVFDEVNEKRLKQYSGKGTVIKHEEPQAHLSLNGSGIGFAEIGVDDILNFTGNSGDLNFTDYKAAYTYNSIIEKPEMNRKQYKNVKELEAERDNISFKLSDKEAERQAAIQNYNDKLEEQRRLNIERYDNRIQDQYKRIHSNLITN